MLKKAFIDLLVRAFLGLGLLSLLFRFDLVIMLVHRLNKRQYHSQTNQDIKNGKEFSARGRGGKIAITDSCKGDYREVEAINPGPAFQIMVDDRTQTKYKNRGKKKVPVLVIPEKGNNSAQKYHGIKLQIFHLFPH